MSVTLFRTRRRSRRERSVAANLITNGGAEVNTTGWVPSNATLTRDTTRARYGVASFKSVATATAAVEYGFVSPNPVVVGGVAYLLLGWVYIPTSYAGPAVSLQVANYVGATGTLSVNADMALRDRWQRLSLVFTPAAGDILGNPAWRSAGLVAVIGDTLWFDGMMLVPA